jgi:hypothetical protein
MAITPSRLLGLFRQPKQSEVGDGGDSIFFGGAFVVCLWDEASEFTRMLDQAEAYHVLST